MSKKTIRADACTSAPCQPLPDRVAGAPREAIQRIYREAARIVTEPDFRDKQIIANGYELVANSPGEFAAYLRKVSEIYAKAIEISGAKID